MIIIVTLTKEEFKNATKLFFFKREIVQRFLTVFAITLILDAFRFGESQFVWTIQLIKFIGLFGLVYFFLFIVPYWIFKGKPSVFSSFNEIKTKYEIGEDSFSITSDMENKLVNWSELRNIFFIENIIFLELNTRRIYIIPKKYFNTEKEVYQFTTLVSNKIRENSLLKGKQFGTKLYKYGWFCLIPIFGFFVGLYLAIKGFFKFRNNTLGVIGLIGILFNLILFSVVFYHVQYSKKGEKELEDLSKEELDSVVRDIESYKVFYSNYPNNLDEVLKVDNLCPISDPFIQSTISPFDNKTNIEFHYKMIGKNYTLFSVGRDRLPNTPDDIYPTMIDSLNIHTGLIKLKK